MAAATAVRHEEQSLSRSIGAPASSRRGNRDGALQFALCAPRSTYVGEAPAVQGQVPARQATASLAAQFIPNTARASLGHVPHGQFYRGSARISAAASRATQRTGKQRGPRRARDTALVHRI